MQGPGLCVPYPDLCLHLSPGVSLLTSRCTMTYVCVKKCAVWLKLFPSKYLTPIRVYLWHMSCPAYSLLPVWTLSPSKTKSSIQGLSSLRFPFLPWLTIGFVLWWILAVNLKKNLEERLHRWVGVQTGGFMVTFTGNPFQATYTNQGTLSRSVEYQAATISQEPQKAMCWGEKELIKCGERFS